MLDDWLYRRYQLFGNKSLPTLVDNVVAVRKSEVAATLWQFSVNVVTTLQSRNFTKFLTMSFQR